MAGLRTDFYHLSMYWLTLTVTSVTSTSLCLMVSCATAVYSAAFLGCGAFYILYMLSSGFVLPVRRRFYDSRLTTRYDTIRHYTIPRATTQPPLPLRSIHSQP